MVQYTRNNGYQIPSAASRLSKKNKPMFLACLSMATNMNSGICSTLKTQRTPIQTAGIAAASIPSNKGNRFFMCADAYRPGSAPRATDVRIDPASLSRGSLHPACWSIFCAYGGRARPKENNMVAANSEAASEPMNALKAISLRRRASPSIASMKRANL